MKLIYEKSKPGRRASAVPDPGLPAGDVPEGLRRSAPPRLPEMAEPELVRHITELSTRNFGIDTGFYPLGSCTMKYNPQLNEQVAGLPGSATCTRPSATRSARGRWSCMYRLRSCLRARSSAWTRRPCSRRPGRRAR